MLGKSNDGRYDVSKIVRDGSAEDAESNQALSVEFWEQMVKRARAVAAWSMEGGIDEKWAAVSGALTESADVLLGKVRGHQPDRIRESMSTLKPQLQGRDCAYAKWLATRKEAELVRFKQVRNVMRRAIRATKNIWFQSKVEEAEREHFGGKRVWKCIRDMQHGHKGLMP